MTDTNENITNDTTESELRAQLADLQRENAKLKVKKERPIGLKVSEKGGVSMYGLGRFPVTLYKSQWLKLLERKDEVAAFIEAHDGELAVKGE